MNHFHFKESGSKKHLDLKFSDIKNQTMGEFYKSGIRSIQVYDRAHDDNYHISLTKTNMLGLSGLCFLNGRTSYQADFDAGTAKRLSEVINSIAGGTVI